jgi:N-acetylglucosamine malate deacetylase 1
LWLSPEDATSRRTSMKFSNGPILVAAAHPDDEVLGCGGTMAKLTGSGHAVHVLFFTDGVGARDGAVADRLRSRRRASAEESLSLLGAHEPTFLDFPDNRLDTIAMLDLAQAVERELERIEPQTILTHHPGDLNVDHRAVHEAVMTAARPQPEASLCDVLCFEVASSTEWRTPSPSTAFVPQMAVDISRHLEQKVAALRLYGDEMRAWPHARSIEAIESLARWRGASFGVAAAEVFSLARAKV